MTSIKIHWVKCRSYKEAQGFRGIVYVHSWNDKPFYWGKAEKSYFGGGTRKHSDGSKQSSRYNYGYRHWIEGCLRHGGSLHIGKLDSKGKEIIDQLENYLINWYPPEINKKSKPLTDDIPIIHSGDIPPFIKKENPNSKNQSRFIRYSGFGDRLSKAMDNVGMSQTRLASISNLTQPQIYNYKSGKTSPKIYVVQKLSYLLEVDYNWLKSGKGEMMFYNITNYPKEHFFKSLPERISFLLWWNGKTIKELAVEINRSQTAITQWIEGNRNPNNESLLELSRVLKKPIKWILYNDF